MDEPLLLQHRDERGVIALTLNRPQALNALSEAMLEALGEALDALASRKCARSLHLSTTSAYSPNARP
jgi:enoyl-CoA hydratase/carnithine racemase